MRFVWTLLQLVSYGWARINEFYVCINEEDGYDGDECISKEYLHETEKTRLHDINARCTPEDCNDSVISFTTNKLCSYVFGGYHKKTRRLEQSSV